MEDDGDNKRMKFKVCLFVRHVWCSLGLRSCFSFQVYVRLKPAAGDSVCKAEHRIVTLQDPQKGHSSEFVFDRVFGGDSTQDAIFTDIGPPLVCAWALHALHALSLHALCAQKVQTVECMQQRLTSACRVGLQVEHAMQGYNACCFAYGQTGRCAPSLHDALHMATACQRGLCCNTCCSFVQRLQPLNQPLHRDHHSTNASPAPTYPTRTLPYPPFHPNFGSCPCQPCSGKTFSMFGKETGEHDLRGMIPRASEELFKIAGEVASGSPVRYSFFVSFLEIYLEQV